MAISSSAPGEVAAAATTTETSSILEPTRRWASETPPRGRREERTDRRPVKGREEDRSMRGRDAEAVGDAERDAEAKTMAISTNYV